MDGYYSVPAGHVDGAEKVTTAMIREAQEEIALDLDKDNLKVIHVMHRMVSATEERIDFFFECKKWRSRIANNEPEKCDELKWVDIDKLPKNTIPYIHSAIKHYRKQILYSEFDE